MRDPLRDFDWSSLYDRYDAKCKRFNSEAVHLRAVASSPRSDRELYYHIVDHVRMADDRPSGLSIDFYEALLYWKLYSNPPALANVRRLCDQGVRAAQSENLNRLLSGLPRHLARNADDVVGLVRQLNAYEVLGMKDAKSLPVRTTFLHYLFPDIVPIFDAMVLKAIGRDEPNANHSVDMLCEYLPHAWELADRHAARLPGDWRETPIRLIDMALWVVRGEGSDGGAEGARRCPT